MQNFSLTQAGNIGVLVGFIVLLLKYFGIAIAEEEIMNLFSAIITIVGLGTSWYGRYRRGDLQITGIRK